VANTAVRTLRPVIGRDLRTLPLNPREAFLLSRIDRAVTEADLRAITGFDATTITECVERLAALGAIELDGGPAINERATEGVFATQETRPVEAPRVSHTQVNLQRSPELDEPCDLDDERKRKVLDLSPRIAQLDYYAMLGVAESADKKDIKRAYYGVAPTYHPDKFYGKNLGSFKPKMEAIFAQLTFAYETLSSAERRAEYDTYLSTQRQTRSMEELLQSATVPSERPAVPAVEIPRIPIMPRVSLPPQANAEVIRPIMSLPPEPITGINMSTMSVPTESSTGAGNFGRRTKDSDRARREALARKLSGSIPPAARASMAPPTSQASQQAAAQELKRRHDAFAADSSRARARRYVDAAAAVLKTNPAAAANALKLALTMDPENPEIITAHREAARLAAVALADGYLKQADYEGRNGQWLEAAKSYARAAAGMPNDANVMHKAAEALLKSSGDMRQAVEFAKKAVFLAPRRLELRFTLIEVYIATGLPLAAKRELEQAREMSPRDDRIAELSKRLK